MHAVQKLSKETSVEAACAALHVSRSSLYRYLSPAAQDSSSPRVHPRALDEDERAEVLSTLTSERFVDCAPAAVHAALLEDNRYLCSVSTMYRVLAASKAVRERRAQRRHPRYEAPQLLATRPSEVWSWDITKLLGTRKWEYFHLYVMLDIFSRYVVGWMVAEHESGALAKELIAACHRRQGIAPGTLTIHSDRGTAMMSKPVVGLLHTLDVHKTVSRPHVSNDNPFIEAHFKTMKYRPCFPRRFGCIQDARATLEAFFRWYNSEHRHSGIGYMTPEVVHHGRAEVLQTQRAKTLMAAFAQHPERFVRGRPTPAPLPEAVWINPPSESPASKPTVHVCAAVGPVACAPCTVPRKRHLPVGCRGAEQRSRARSGEPASAPLRVVEHPGTGHYPPNICAASTPGAAHQHRQGERGNNL